MGFVAAMLLAGTACGQEDMVLPLTLRDAVDVALARNLGLSVERLYVPITDTEIQEAEAVFEPRWDSSVTYSKLDSPNANIFTSSGGAGGPVVPGDTPIDALATDPNITLDEFRVIMIPFLGGVDAAGASVSHFRQEDSQGITGLYDRTEWGTQYSLETDLGRSEVNNDNDLINPGYNTTTRLTVSQPLLRNFGRDINTTQVRIAEISTESQELGYRLMAIALVSQVEDAYWEVFRRKEDVDIAKASVQTAQDLLEQNKTKVEVGVLRPIEVLSAESGLSSRKQTLILAEKALVDAHDNLKRLLELRDGSNLWDVELQLVDEAGFEVVEPNLEEDIRDAKDQRLELQQQDRLIEIYQVAERFDKNQLLPALDVFGGVSARGLGDDTGDSYDPMFDADHISGNVGLLLSVPLGNRAARARHRRSQLQLEQSEVARANIERALEQEVRFADRTVVMAQELVEAAAITVNFATKRLAAEKTAYEEGVTTSHEVLRFEEDLTTARGFYNQALIGHLQALVSRRVARGDVLETAGVELVSALDETR